MFGGDVSITTLKSWLVHVYHLIRMSTGEAINNLGWLTIHQSVFPPKPLNLIPTNCPMCILYFVMLKVSYLSVHAMYIHICIYSTWTYICVTV